MELDGDDVAVTYIKDVIFNANRQDVEVLRMTKVLLETHFLNNLQRKMPLHILYSFFIFYSMLNTV